MKGLERYAKNSKLKVDIVEINVAAVELWIHLFNKNLAELIRNVSLDVIILHNVFMTSLN